MSFQLHHRFNEDGSSTYTVMCGLDYIEDHLGNITENPIRRLRWSEEANLYEVIEEGDEVNDPGRTLYKQSSSLDEDGLLKTGLSGVDSILYQNRTKDNIVLARECWCAAIFQGTLNEPGQPVDSTSVVRNPPVWYPVDTNGDFNDGKPSFGDPNVCRAQAIVGQDGVVHTAPGSYLAACYVEDRLAEFVRSAWPLCCFWVAMLIYLWFATNYGRRCRGYVWRTTKLFMHGRCCVMCGGSPLRQIEAPPPPDVEEGRSPVAARGEGGEIAVGTTLDQSTPTETNNSSNENEDQPNNTSMELVVPTTRNTEDSVQNGDDLPPPYIDPWFGSYENYEMLDHDMRDQAERTNNEFISWLWYSAVQMEERRVKRERLRRRREERRRRRRGEDPDEGSMLSTEQENLRAMLAPVYWWPPAYPDGGRWEHLVNLTSLDARVRRERRRRRRMLRTGDNNEDDDSNDDSQPQQECLFLRTKVFCPSKPETIADHEHFEAGKRDRDDNQDVSVEDTNKIRTIGGADSTPSEKKDDSPPQTTSTIAVENSNSDDSETNDPDTTIANSYSNLEEEDISENTCSICLCEIEEGELVGDIPCGHYFHKDCLKEWLMKSNHCPSCRRPGIALYQRTRR